MTAKYRSGEKGFLLSLASMGHLDQEHPNPQKITVVMKMGGVLADVTLEFTAGAWGRDSPAGTMTPLPRKPLIPMIYSQAVGKGASWVVATSGSHSRRGHQCGCDNVPDPGKVCKCKANEP